MSAVHVEHGPLVDGERHRSVEVRGRARRDRKGVSRQHERRRRNRVRVAERRVFRRRREAYLHVGRDAARPAGDLISVLRVELPSVVPRRVVGRAGLLHVDAVPVVALDHGEGLALHRLAVRAKDELHRRCGHTSRRPRDEAVADRDAARADIDRNRRARRERQVELRAMRAAARRIQRAFLPRKVERGAVLEPHVGEVQRLGLETPQYADGFIVVDLRGARRTQKKVAHSRRRVGTHQAGKVEIDRRGIDIPVDEGHDSVARR